MADLDLQERVIKLLSGKPKKTETLAKLVQTLRVPKKSLNNQLYMLQRKGRIIKVQESPPVWALQDGASSTALTVRATRSRRKSDDCVPNRKQEDEQLMGKILQFLRGRQKPSKSLEIAKGTGHARAHDVNTTLYKMQEKGLINKLSEKPPTWLIAEGNVEIHRMNAFEGAAATRLESSADCSATAGFPATDSGIPVFQETELFNTAVNYETELDLSEAFTSTDDGNESEADDDESRDNYDNEINNQITKEEADHVNAFCSDQSPGIFRGDSPVLAASSTDDDISTQGTYKLFEKSGDSYISDDCSKKPEVTGDDSNEFDEDSRTQNELGAEESMELYSGSLNTVNCTDELGGTIIETTYDLEEERNEHIEMDTENEITKSQLVHEAPEFDRDYIKKPRTFRDMFQLDDAISDDTSSSFDSAKGIDAELKAQSDSTGSSLDLTERKSTPEIPIVTAEKSTPEQNIVPSEWHTPQMLDEVLDLQEAVAAGSVNVSSESSSGVESFKPALDESEMVSEMKVLENTPSGPFVCPTHALEAKDEISQVEMDDGSLEKETDNTEKSEVKLSESNMEDCDKVLKVLLELRSIAQFVLKRKTDIPPENLDEVLQKCLSLNYVSGSSKLWKITDEGMNYISKKTGQSNTVSESEKFMQPEKKVRPASKGPPPSPMALLGRSETDFSRNQAVSESVKQNSRAQSSFSLHSTGSLFKPPSVSNSSTHDLDLTGSSLVSKRVVSDASNSGPKPLMSIQLDSNSVNRTKFAVPQSSRDQSSVGHGNVQSLMSVQFESRPVDKTRTVLPHQSSSQMQLGQDRTKNSARETKDQKSGETMVQYNQYSQNQQMLNSNLWGTGMISEGSNGFKSQVSDSSYSSGQFHQSSVQTGSQKPVLGSQNFVKQDPRLTSPLNSRKASPSQDTQVREIPSKYADYPNQSTSLQSLKSKTHYNATKKPAPVCPSKSAFNRGPPPSPLDILSKGLKKTEISPPGSYKDKISVSHPSGSFSTMSLTNRSTGTSNQAPEIKSVFTVGQFAQSGSHSYSNSGSAGSKMEQTVNQSSGFKQTGTMFGSQSKQSGFQTLGTTANQSGSSFGSSAARPVTGGPPPPPAVKLGLQVAQSTSAQVTIPKAAQNSSNPVLGLSLNTESFNALNKNPVSALMEYAQSRKMVARIEVLGRKGSSHKPTFEMAAFVGNRKFPSVNCQNKKDGRKEACDIALRQIVAEGQFKAEASSTSGVPPVPSANMTHFDTIAALTHRGFTALVSQIAESFAGRKVIAGLVMKRSADDTGVLISLGTGNRCITGPQLSLQGNTVNDSHAEIITRRGFLRFLYKQLLEFNPSRPHPMFEKSPSGKLKIRPNITFHLYISTAPCGDGALFSPRDSESSKAPADTRIRPPHEPTFSNNVQGLLRTKVEGGEGTIPIEPGFKGQTFDGIQRGERLRTMSCTDKICRWNVVGMQGALLSHFLEPIYLDSLTLGLLYDHGHLSRAVCCRVGRGSVDVNTELPPDYRLNHPWLGRVTVCDPPREVQKTKAFSVNWCFGDKGPEVTDGTLGLCYTSIEKGFFSRCSKRNLFTCFKSLCEKFGRQDLLQVSSYNEAKVAAQDFVYAKQVMLKRFKENGFGKWVSKPVEEEMFGFDEQK